MFISQIKDEELKKAIPFAVIGSNTILEVNGKRVRGRQYPWGIVEVENPKHSDFSKLRSVLVSTHMQDLKVSTHMQDLKVSTHMQHLKVSVRN